MNLIIIGFGFSTTFLLLLIILQLAGLRRSFDLLGQVVAVGIQRAGLVRTHEEVTSDMEEAGLSDMEQAQEDLDNEISEAELETEEALKVHKE